MTRKLDRLQASNAPGLPRGLYTNQQRVCEQIEAAFTDQDAINAELASQLAQILAAQAAADAAAADAATAQTAADLVKLQNSISASWTVPSTVLTATDAGSDVTIAVIAHVRHYDDGTTVSVNGHNFTGQPYSVDRAVYYDDATRSDTTPSYQITSSLATAQANQASGRHRVGAVTTPAAGAPPTTGGSAPPGTSSHGPDYVIP